MSDPSLLYSRVDATGRRVVCGAQVCGATLGQRRKTLRGRILEFEGGWRAQYSATLKAPVWAISKHAQSLIAIGRKPHSRRSPAPLLRRERLGVLPKKSLPTPTLYPAFLKCPSCGRLQILDASQLGVMVELRGRPAQPIGAMQALTNAAQLAIVVAAELSLADRQLVTRLSQEPPEAWTLPPLSIVHPSGEDDRSLCTQARRSRRHRRSLHRPEKRA